MAVYASPSADNNPAYHANGEYDALVIKTFFDQLTDALAPQSFDGGDTDRLSASAVIGRNSVAIRMTPKDDLIITDDQPPASVLSATLENEAGTEDEIEVRFDRQNGESQAEATERWVETFRALVLASVASLGLPVHIPAALPTSPISGAPVFLVPQEWVAG